MFANDGELEYEEIFEYPFTKLDPVGGDHIDPPSVAVYETLMRKGSGEAVLPGLAERWSVSDDGLTWTLQIRPDAVFHSGDPCESAAVVAALERCRWGDGRMRQLWYWDPVDRVIADGPTTVKLQLNYPYLRLPTLLWGTHTAIHNDKRRSALGSEFGAAAADGTGPYRLVRYSPEEVLAEGVPGRLRADLHGPRRLRWRSVRSEAGRAAAVQNGRADVVRAVDPEWLPAEGRFRLIAQPEISQFYLALNFDDPLGFGELALRRAIEAFVDRPALVRDALSGRGDARRSPVPAGDRFAEVFDAESTVPMSREEASATLDALGFALGDGGVRRRDGVELRVSCVSQDAEPFRRLAAALAAQLGVAGVAIDYQFLQPFEPFYRACVQRPQAILSKWLWPDAIEAVIGFSRSDCSGDGGGNWQGANLPRLDRAFDDYLQAPTASELEERAADVQRVFVEELAYLPLCSPLETYAVANDLKGFRPMLGTLYPYYDELGTAP